MSVWDCPTRKPTHFIWTIPFYQFLLLVEPADIGKADDRLLQPNKLSCSDGSEAGVTKNLILNLLHGFGKRKVEARPRGHLTSCIKAFVE